MFKNIEKIICVDNQILCAESLRKLEKTYDYLVLFKKHNPVGCTELFEQLRKLVLYDLQPL